MNPSEEVHRRVNRDGLHVFISAAFGVFVGKKSGTGYKIQCPKHRPGHTRSAWTYVWPNGGNQTFMCGKCLDKPVDAIDFMVWMGEALTRKESIGKLLKKLPES